LSTRVSNISSLTAQRITELRQKIGINSSELGRRAKVSRAAVDKWESGASTPAGENLERLATVLATSVDYLALRTDDPSPRSDNLEQARVFHLASRYGLDPKLMSQLLEEIASPPPDDVDDAMQDLRMAREALQRAERKMASLFGGNWPEYDGMVPQEIIPEFARRVARGVEAFDPSQMPFSMEYFKDFEEELHRARRGKPKRRDAGDLHLRLYALGLHREDFRPQYTDETIEALVAAAETDQGALELLKSMTVPMKHKPGVSRGKAARADLENGKAGE
jgi:transcriptional regulator with XRE-family HTH domain